MKTILGMLLCTISLFGQAAETEDLIGVLHAATSQSTNAEAAKGYVEFKFKTKALASPCGWLNLTPDDSNALSILLSAQAQQKKVRVNYHTDRGAPWGATSCSVSSVAIWE